MYGIKVTHDSQVIGVNYEDSYNTIKEAVGGYIESVNLTNGITMWINEEGKLLDLPFNTSATAIFWADFGARDFIVGDVFFTCIDENGETKSLDDRAMEYLNGFLEFEEE